MPPSSSAHLRHALAFTFLFHAFTTLAGAQGFRTYGQNSRSFGKTHENLRIQISQDIGKNVYLVDNLADQMLYIHSLDLKPSSQSESGEALLKQMRRHAELTNELINAYRGKGETFFQNAAVAVNNSITTMLELKRDARISETVSNMINQSLPLIAFVNQNARHYSISAKT